MTKHNNSHPGSAASVIWWSHKDNKQTQTLIMHMHIQSCTCMVHVGPKSSGMGLNSYHQEFSHSPSGQLRDVVQATWTCMDLIMMPDGVTLHAVRAEEPSCGTELLLCFWHWFIISIIDDFTWYSKVTTFAFFMARECHLHPIKARRNKGICLRSEESEASRACLFLCV